MSTKKLTFTAIISCLAYIMVFFKVPVSFLSYEIKDVVIAIGAIYLGGISGVLISFIVSLIEMITISNSGIIGFITNFLATITYILPICYIYKKNGYIIKGVLLGTISMSVAMFLLNIIATPLYLKVPLNETIHLLFTLITPFNIIKGALNGLLIFLLYKPLLNIMQKSNANA